MHFLIHLQILKIERTNNAARDRNSRRRFRRSENKIITVQEEEHLACSCQCITKKDDCIPEVHDYDKSSCSCKCRNK